MSNSYSYRQYGDVALIVENDRAICTAKFKDGRWTTWTYPYVGAEKTPRYPGPERQSAKSLDALVAVIVVQADRQCAIEQFGVERA